MQIKQNKLYLGGIKAIDLVKEYGSPLYVYEEETIRQRYRELKNSINYSKIRINYACKANTNHFVMKILREEGSCIDAVSPEEVYLALRANFKPSQILFTGNNITNEEMKFVVGKGVMINVDSLSQFRRYGKMFPSTKVSVRINPNIGAGHHEHCITGGPDSKFGICYNKIGEIKNVAEEFDLKIIGVHEHIGSGILDSSKFIKAMKVLLDVAKEFEGLEFIDFGGGIGVPYKPDEKRLNLKKFGREVVELFERFCKIYGKKLILAIEPGRFLVCESGFLLAKVNTVKVTDDRIFVGVNSGFNHLVRPTMYNSYHQIINASRVNGKVLNYDVAGNICESGDLFARNRPITEIKEGDVLAILNAGAYGFSMSSNYNSRLKPAEILVKNGKPKIIRQKEKFKDLMSGK